MTGTFHAFVCRDCLNGFESREESHGHWTDDEGQGGVCGGEVIEVVAASSRQGAVDLLRRVNALDLGSNPPVAVLDVLVDIEQWLRSNDQPAER